LGNGIFARFLAEFFGEEIADAKPDGGIGQEISGEEVVELDHVKKGLSRRDAGTQRRFFKAVDTAGDAGLQNSLAEVKQVAELQSSQPQIGLHLFLMGWIHSLHGFEFQKHFVFRDEIGAKSLIEFDAPIFNPDGHLPLHMKPSVFQAIGQNDFVNRFQQARAEVSVNLNRLLDHHRADFVFAHFPILRASASLREFMILETKG
jgi:hypothetical protein